MSKREVYICIDFDGTIVFHEYPNIGAEVSGALFYMDKFIKAGAKLILFTMRSHGELDDAVEYLKNNQIKMFGINQNPTQAKWTSSPKAYGHIYIDDAAFGCPLKHVAGHRPCVDWSKVGPAVLKRIKNV